MRIDSSLIYSQHPAHDDDQIYNFRCCISRRLSGHREKEVCDLVSEDDLSVWDSFNNDCDGIGEHFVVAGEALFFRHLSDGYHSLTCEGPQFGASLRKIVDQFTIKDIYIQGGAHITIDAFREILERRDITLNQLRSLVSFHESGKLRSVCMLMGTVVGHVAAHLGTILTITALAGAYLLRKTKPGWLLAITTIALHVLHYLEKTLKDPHTDIEAWMKLRKKAVQAYTPSIVKTAWRLLLISCFHLGRIVLPAMVAAVIYRSSRQLVGRLNPIASAGLNYLLEKADEYPRSTIVTILVVSALFAEIGLQKLREEDERRRERAKAIAANVQFRSGTAGTQAT